MWLSSTAGLLKFDRTHNKVIRYHNNPIDRESLEADNLIVLYQDHEGNIWTCFQLQSRTSSQKTRCLFRTSPTNVAVWSTHSSLRSMRIRTAYSGLALWVDSTVSTGGQERTSCRWGRGSVMRSSRYSKTGKGFFWWNISPGPSGNQPQHGRVKSLSPRSAAAFHQPDHAIDLRSQGKFVGRYVWRCRTSGSRHRTFRYVHAGESGHDSVPKNHRG